MYSRYILRKFRNNYNYPILFILVGVIIRYVSYDILLLTLLLKPLRS